MFFSSNNNKKVEINRINKEYIYKVKDKNIKFKLKGIAEGTFDNKKEILDEIVLRECMKEVSNIVGGRSTKYINIPKSISIDYTGQTDKLDKHNEDISIFEVESSNVSFKDVYIEKECKEIIENTLLMIKEKDKIFNEWGLKDTFKSERSVVLNFYGKPGTGKSIVAKAIANELGKKILIVNYSDLESKYVGETPKNIKKVFSEAKKNDAVILFDEADSFLGKRLENITASADYGVNISRSVMLIELEKFDGVVIFTTNLLKNYDTAFKRRIFANVEFKYPDYEGRKYLWNIFLSSKTPIERDITKDILAHRYENITGADIKDIILFASLNSIRENRNSISLIDFDKGYSNIERRYLEEKNSMSEPRILSVEKVSVDEIDLKKDEVR